VILEPLAYGLALAFFGYVILATARMQHDMMLVLCIPPVFVALIMGFVMAVYAGDTFGLKLPFAALVPAAAGAWWVPRLYAPRDQLIAIYLAWAVGMVCALIGVGMPDAA
jgi:hypothetical protein